MVKSVFITDSGIDRNTGGGIVSYNMIESLKKFNLQYIFCKRRFLDNKYENINTYTINAFDYNLKNMSPFITDYLAYHLIPREPRIDLVVTYGCPFGLTVEEMKRSFDAKIICDLPPHNIKISQEEHIKFFGSYEHPHLTDDRLWGLYSRHLRIADMVIVHSKKSAEYIQEKAKLREPPQILPHGCQPPEVIPEYPEQTIPGYFGSLGNDKGIVYMANAWIKTPHPENIQMLLGGRESTLFNVEEKYKTQFKQLGFIPDISDFYKQISIYIQASVTEGFGITPLEAMAYGRPVIVAEGVGMSDIVTDGKDGFVVPIRDIDAITDKIIYFQSNPSEIKRMGMEARKTAEKHTWTIINEKYGALYKEVL